MKVLQVNSVCGRGSTGRIAVALHDALRARGDQCLVAYGRGQHDPDVNAFRIGSSLSTGLHAGLSRLTDRQGFYSFAATRRLADRIDEFQPDVIHLHNIHGYYLNLPVLFGALERSTAPIVWTLHDCWAFTGHCAYFDFVGCDKWRSFCARCPQKHAYPASYVLDSSRRNFYDKRQLTGALPDLTLVTPSAWLAGLVTRSFLKEHPVKVIRNGVDQSVFRPTPSDFKTRHGIKGKFMVLGVASEWSPRKGLEDFIELRGRLSDDYVIVLVGVDAKTAGDLPRGVIAIEKTDSASDLAAIYAAADVFFNPTHEDNYPTTNLEAISCGTPVVTYDTGGSPESVSELSGVVVPEGDTFQATKAITGLCQRGSRPSALAWGSFDNGVMTMAYLDLYDRQAS